MPTKASLAWKFFPSLETVDSDTSPKVNASMWSTSSMPTKTDVSPIMSKLFAFIPLTLDSYRFLQIVLPCEDNLLRNITLDRHATRVGRFDHLPRDIESALASVFEQEINLQRRMNVLKKDLEYSYDFSTYAAFRSIDRDNNGILSTFEMS